MQHYSVLPLSVLVQEFLSKETLHCVNVIRQISSTFCYLSRSALPGIPDDNGISRSRDRIGRYCRRISADNPHQTFRLDKLTRKNNKLNIYPIITTVVPYCKLCGILPRNSTEQKEHFLTQCRIRHCFVIAKWFSFNFIQVNCLSLRTDSLEVHFSKLPEAV